jgi:hypothetical protein
MKPHHTDRWSLGVGLLFLLIVGWWLLASQVHIDAGTAGWLIAGGLIVFGTFGLLRSLRPRRTAEAVSGPPASGDEW